MHTTTTTTTATIMLTIAHWILVALYIGIVPAGIAYAAVQARRIKRFSPVASLVVTCLVGVVLGTAVSVIYARAVQGRIVYSQIALAAYFAAAMLLLIKSADRLLRRGLVRLFRVGPDSASGQAKMVRMQLAGSVRVILLFALALPYVMAAVMTYRPKVALADDPKTQLGFAFEAVSFEATDGTPLRGWWIPAEALRPSRRWGAGRPGGIAADVDREQWGQRSVLLCHGLGANRSNQLIMCRSLVPAGYNVLALDFRAHGESGGQLTTFGDRERYDVLGAVRWLRAEHPRESKKIFGLGASMGAAALIAAAADDSAEGQAIDALALYAGYDDLRRLARSITRDRFVFPVNWLAMHVSFPLASLQVGTDLADFAPADLVKKVWPRPILFIHGKRDEIIPFERGQELYESADVPKWHIWLDRGDHNTIINSEFVAELVRRFFDKAEPMPVI